MLSEAHARKQSEPRPTTFQVSQPRPDERAGVIAVEGELDLAAAPRLKWTLVDLLRGGCSQLVLDLAEVSFMDSTALGVLVGFDRSLSAGERLAIARPQPEVLKIFELTGLDGAFRIFSSVDQALAYARGGVNPAR